MAKLPTHLAYLGAIFTFTDTAFECPECGRRLNFGDPVDRDEDGDIYEGTCLIHGTFLVQAVDEPDDDEDYDDQGNLRAGCGHNN